MTGPLPLSSNLDPVQEDHSWSPHDDQASAAFVHCSDQASAICLHFSDQASAKCLHFSELVYLSHHVVLNWKAAESSVKSDFLDVD